MVTICTYNARTLAFESSLEDWLMQARMIRYDVISQAETRRRHPFDVAYNTGEELFLGTCDSREVGGVGALVNMNTVVDNIDEEYDRLIQHLHASAIKAECSIVTKRRLFPETLELIRQRGIARTAGNCELTSEMAKQWIKEDHKGEEKQ
uniref:HNH endonuclease n=1 Tax=Angiostrongylus cantonensis TaxID=6313 RepID=A0A0K0CST6_ANGCA